MKNDELTVRTPLGELVVGIKADPDYPGISAAFCGNGMNDRRGVPGAPLLFVVQKEPCPYYWTRLLL